MTSEVKINHARGLCGLPDLPSLTIAREVAEADPPLCKCCGSKMKIKECTSLGMQQAGMFWLICPTCPGK